MFEPAHAVYQHADRDPGPGCRSKSTGSLSLLKTPLYPDSGTSIELATYPRGHFVHKVGGWG